MKCSNCNSYVHREWKYCPKCGTRFRMNLFSDIFSRFNKEFREFDKMFSSVAEMNKMLEREFEALDISPFFKKETGKGFTVRIVRTGKEKPQVYVKTYGDVDEESIKKQIASQLGIEAPIKVESEGPAKTRGQKTLKEIPKRAQPKKEITLPDVTEEPQADIRRLDGRVTVDIELPGVISEDNIQISELESSVEVKATAGDRGYFKILTKPAQFRLISKSFSNNKLHMEFA